MKGCITAIGLAFILLVSSSCDIRAQNKKVRILFLLDGSGSMYGTWQKAAKIDAAKKLLTHMVDSLDDLPDVQIALRAFGHRSPKTVQDCKDTRLEVPFGEHNAEQIKSKLKDIIPKGTTPIAYSLTMAASDFPADKNSRNIVILITDGIEECGGDPCAVSVALQKRGIFLKPFIIGLDIKDEFIDKLNCMGNFFNAKNEVAFEKILGVVVSTAINSTTAQINLLDEYAKPTETDVNISIYDAKTGLMKYSFLHTLNAAGYPDTLFIDCIPTYNIIAHTIPPVEKKEVKLSPAIHNIIPLNTPQGTLTLKITGLTNYLRLQAVIKAAGTDKIIHVQDVSSSQKYITGKYDIEILTLPRITLKNIEIRQSTNTTLEIPQPGKLTILSNQAMIGGIFQLRDNKLEWVCDIDPNQRAQNIIMQPGVYYIYYKRKGSMSTYYTSETEFKISSGGSTTVNIK